MGLKDSRSSIAEVDVLIVGGGPAGLTSTIQLSQLGVSSLVFERRDGTSKVPKAHYLNARTMEIFDQMGVANAVYEAGAAVENISTTTMYTSFGGSGLNARRIVHQWDSFGGGALRADYERSSAQPAANLPQKHLEPILRRFAEQANPGKVLFEHELLSLDECDEGVTATYRNADGEHTVRAKYVIAADGGNTVGPALGAKMEGLPPFVRMIGLHFAADLSEYLQEDTSLIRLVVAPNADGNLVQTGIVGMGPTHWDRHSEEWHLNIVVPVGDTTTSDDWTDEMAIEQIRDLLGIDGLPATILKINEWDIEGVLADRYRIGRTFLVGDAAHRHPPTTGLGLNAAVADTHNLMWKLAAVLQGRAEDALLDTYEAERRPVGARNVDWAMFTFFNHLAGHAGWGVLPGAPAETNVGAYHATLADTTDGRARLARLREFLNTQRAEYQARDVELGYTYVGSTAIVADGSADIERDPLGTNYQQQTRPGGRLPHAWVNHEETGRVSTHWLLRPGAFLVLTGAAGDEWSTAAQKVAAELSIEVNVVSIGAGQCNYTDEDGAWRSVRDHGDGGVVVVRPDGHVLYRAARTVADTFTELSRVLSAGLGRSPATGDR